MTNNKSDIKDQNKFLQPYKSTAALKAKINIFLT